MAKYFDYEVSEFENEQLNRQRGLSVNITGDNLPMACEMISSNKYALQAYNAQPYDGGVEIMFNVNNLVKFTDILRSIGEDSRKEKIELLERFANILIEHHKEFDDSIGLISKDFIFLDKQESNLNKANICVLLLTKLPVRPPLKYDDVNLIRDLYDIAFPELRNIDLKEFVNDARKRLNIPFDTNTSSQMKIVSMINNVKKFFYGLKNSLDDKQIVANSENADKDANKHSSDSLSEAKTITDAVPKTRIGGDSLGL